MNPDFHKITKNFILQETYNPNVLEFLNILEGNLRLIKATNRGDQSRLDAAKNIIREVKSRVKKLEEKVSVLEERLKVLEEGTYDEPK